MGKNAMAFARFKSCVPRAGGPQLNLARAAFILFS